MTDIQRENPFEAPPVIDRHIPTAEEAEILLTDVDAREARDAALRAQLPAPDPDNMRGRVRESTVTDPDAEPPVIDPFVIVSLGKRLDQRRLPLFDQFTASYHFSSAEGYDRYVIAPPRRNKDKTERPVIDPTRDKRQVKNVAYRVQGEIRTNLRVAHERLASLRATRRAVAAGQLLLPSTTVMAADAIEDLAYGLRENAQVFEGILFAEALDHKMEHIGKHAGLHPEDFYDLDLLMKLVVREQLKRRGFWLGVVRNVLSVDRDRRGRQARAEAADLRAKITELDVYTNEELATIY